MAGPTFTLYTKANCPLCDEAKTIMQHVQQEMDFSLEVVDIGSNRRLEEAYALLVPVVTMDGDEVFIGKVSAHRLRSILKARQRDIASPISQRYRAFLRRLKERAK